MSESGRSSSSSPQPNRADPAIERNVRVHDRIARKYEKIHGEIFNDLEQARLRSTLQTAVGEVRNDHHPLQALDFGCGSGNLTSHLLALGLEVTAADVSTGFLQLVKARFESDRLKIHQLNGSDLSELRDGSFDLVATYSVLHHVPDYLGACAEMARVCTEGGVVVIDHEASPNSWHPDPELERFRREATLVELSKYARPINYLHRIRRIFNPKHSNEGDIHVWPDDHIEWDAIDQLMRESGCEVVVRNDYLLSRRNYRRDVFERYRDRCKDTRVTIYRRSAGAGNR